MSRKQTELLANKIMIEFSKTIEMFDLTPLEARVFSCLYLAGEPLTLDDMSEYLGNSKTSMSNGVRTLLNLNLIKRVWRRGERKNLYEANDQLFKSFMTSYIHKWNDAITHQKHSLLELNKIIKELKEDHDKCNNLSFLENRLNKIIHFHTLVDKSFRSLE